MSSDWQYTGTKLISKIYCRTSYDSIPIKHNWIVVLNDGLNIPLFHDSLKTLTLTTDELAKIKEAEENARELAKIEASVVLKYGNFPSIC
jgi:hypothetical protein